MFCCGFNLLRTRSVKIGRGSSSDWWSGPCGFPEGGVWAPRPAPGGGDQPVPQWNVLPPVPPPAPEPGPSLHPRGSHLHRQIHAGAVPERKGTASKSNFFSCLRSFTGNHRVFSVLSLLQVPSLIIYGDQDAQLGELSLRNLSSLANNRVVVMKGAGHPCYLEDPDTWHKALTDFLHMLWKFYHERVLAFLI